MVTVTSQPRLLLILGPLGVERISLAARRALLGLGLAMLRHLLDTTVRTDEDVEEVTVEPIIGAVHFDRRADKEPLIVESDPTSPRSEAFRALLAGPDDDQLASAELADTYVASSGSIEFTEQNDYIRVDGPSVWIELSLQSGIVHGFAGLVDSIVARMAAELGPGVTTVATGGLAGASYSVAKSLALAVPKNAATSASAAADPSGLPPRPGALDSVTRPRHGSAG